MSKLTPHHAHPTHPRAHTHTQLANSTQGLNEDCINSFPEDDQWQCNFAQHAYNHTKSHTFPLNSALDSWQTQCIYTSELVDGFPDQTGTQNGNCSAAPGWKVRSASTHARTHARTHVARSRARALARVGKVMQICSVAPLSGSLHFDQVLMISLECTFARCICRSLYATRWRGVAWLGVARRGNGFACQY